MFCPNCGVDNTVGLNYCRKCGLKLDAVVEAVAGQIAAGDDFELHRRRRKVERAGSNTLWAAGVIGLLLLIFFITQYRNFGDFFGPVLLIAIVAMFWFVLVGLGIRSYPKYFMRGDARASSADIPTGATGKLIEDRAFQPARSSVTEATTDLLNASRPNRGN